MDNAKLFKKTNDIDCYKNQMWSSSCGFVQLFLQGKLVCVFAIVVILVTVFLFFRCISLLADVFHLILVFEQELFQFKWCRTFEQRYTIVFVIHTNASKDGWKTINQFNLCFMSHYKDNRFSCVYLNWWLVWTRLSYWTLN